MILEKMFLKIKNSNLSGRFKLGRGSSKWSRAGSKTASRPDHYLMNFEHWVLSSGFYRKQDMVLSCKI